MKRWIVLSALIAAAVILGGVIVHRGTADPHRPQAKTNVVATKPIAVAKPSAAVPPPLAHDNHGQPASSAADSANHVGLDVVIAYMKHERARPLKTRDEKTEFRRMLADVTLIDAAAQELIRFRPGGFTPADEEARMQLVAFLETSLRWQQNPNRARVVAATRTVIEAENYHEYASDERLMRGSLAGDKSELLTTLARYSPEALQEVVDNSLAGRNRKLMEYLLKRKGVELPTAN